ncbi:MAG: glycerol kinase GlpK [Acidobacteriaceae bacterium]|nr:glycerol kinase GlpK [Acidobacteriaceae bacterium]
MEYILALDQGTTSSRAVLYDRQGTIRSLAQREFQQLYPSPGWVEHDPEEIWASQMGVAIEALSRASARPRDIAAIGIANQRETAVVWERKTGKPIHNAIVWQDRRTAPVCKMLWEQGLETAVRSKTGLLIDPYFSATKIMWLLDNVKGAREKAEAGELAFGTVDSWLIWNLTSGTLHTIDASNASRTMLFNIHDGKWDRDLLAAMRIPECLLPQVRSSSGVQAQVTTTLGLADVPITGAAGDQQAALFGQACFHPGMAKCTYGTGAFLLQTLGEEVKPSKNRLLTTVAWQKDNKLAYAMEGSVFAAGSVVQWLRDGLGIIRSSAEVETLALSVLDSADVFVVPAFTGLGAPHWDPHARGTIVGITRGTRAAHIARASLESIAYQVADLIHAMEDDSGLPIQALRVDGGAAQNDVLLQFQADLLGVPVLRPAITETTSLGAAFLAGLAVNYWKDLDEVEKCWGAGKEFHPRMSRAQVEDLRARWHQALGRAKGWSDPEQSVSRAAAAHDAQTDQETVQERMK